MRKRIYSLILACSLAFGAFSFVPKTINAKSKETNSQSGEIEIYEEACESSGKSIVPDGFGVTVDADYIEEAKIALENYETDLTVEKEVYADGEAYTTYSSVDAALSKALDNYQNIVELPTDADSSWSFPYSNSSEISAFANKYLQAHPEYFYVSNLKAVTAGGYVKRFIFTFSDTKENLKKMRGELAVAVAKAAYPAQNDKLTDAEKCLLVHDYLVEHCEYDDDFSALSAEQQKLSMAINAYGALVEGKAVCQGYTAAFSLIMKELKILNVSVSSRTMGEKKADGSYAGHIWNLVGLKNKQDKYNYYHVDVTWDDKDIPGQVKHDNLLVSDQKLSDNGHFGYSVDSGIASLTLDTYYDLFYWVNISSAVYIYDDALYYVYPDDPGCNRYDVTGLTAKVDYNLVKKPVGESADNKNDKNVSVLKYNYGTVEILTDDYSEDDIDKLKSEYKTMNTQGRLAEGASYWYVNSDDKVLRISKEQAKGAVKGEDNGPAYIESDEGIDTLVTVLGDPIEGLIKLSGKLYYSRGGELTEINEDIGVPEPKELFVYKSGETILLAPTVNQYGKTYYSDYQVYACLLPEGSDASTGDDPKIKYAMDILDSGHLEVDGSGFVKSKGYTTDPLDPSKYVAESMTISVPDYPDIETKKLSFKAEPVAVEKIVLSNSTIYKDYTTAQMEANNTVELTTQVLPANASNNIVKYTSTNTKVAKVDPNTGLVTLVGAGEAKIYARLTEKDEFGQIKENGNFEASCAVRVRFKPESITTDKDSVTIIEPERDSNNSPVITDVNKTLVSANVGTVSAYNRSVKWEITDEKVANVKGSMALDTKVISIIPSDTPGADGSYSAEIQAINEGSATVKVTSSVNASVSKVISVTVKKPEKKEEPTTEAPTESSKDVKITGISIKPENVDLTTYGVVDLIAELTPSNADNKGILWTTSDSNAVELKEDKEDPRVCRVTAISRGTVKVTATSLDGAYSATSTITIKKADIQVAKAEKIADKVYNGKYKKPAPVLTINGTKLKKGVDYTVSYKKNKKVGTAVITVKGKGQITGTKSVTFKIIPKATKLTLKKNKKGVLVAKFKKVATADGYQIIVATNKKFTKNKKSKIIYGKTKLKYALTGLKKRKTYYIKARAVKIVGVKKYYSKYTKTYKVRLKK